MGRVFVEQAMKVTGYNRTNLVGIIAHLIRTKQASGQGDAIKKLQEGEFDNVDLEEEMIKGYQIKSPEVLEEDNGHQD